MSTLDQAMNYLADKEWGPIKYLSLGLYRCSGTINGSISYQLRNDGKAAYVRGRVYISNFTRSGANPGFTYTKPDGWNITGSYSVGHRGENATEFVQFYASTYVINTTETFQNATNGRLTFIIPGSLIGTL